MGRDSQLDVTVGAGECVSVVEEPCLALEGLGHLTLVLGGVTLGGGGAGKCWRGRELVAFTWSVLMFVYGL